MSISVVTESGKETVVWEAGVSHGWTHGQVRVNATELIPTEVYQVRKAFIVYIYIAKVDM